MIHIRNLGLPKVPCPAPEVRVKEKEKEGSQYIWFSSTARLSYADA